MDNTLSRRFAWPLACAALTIAGLALAAPPAAATPTVHTVCSQPIGSIEHTAGSVVAEAFRICSDGTERAVRVSIRRQNPSTGVWTTVATGQGKTSYQCQGTTIHRYQVIPHGISFLYPCT